VERLFLLTRGSVELFSEQDDRRFTISVLRSGRLLELCSIFAERHPLSARVLEPSELMSVPTKLICQLIGKDNGFAEAIFHELARESLEIIDEFKKHRLLNTTARIASWMLQCDLESVGDGHLFIPFDKRVLASYLGMTPEQLSRGFASLRSAGVTVEGRTVTIADRPLLTRVATRDFTGIHATSS
jgi:CRP/FNR family transcriptional activator FtrB